MLHVCDISCGAVISSASAMRRNGRQNKGRGGGNKCGSSQRGLIVFGVWSFAVKGGSRRRKFSPSLSHVDSLRRRIHCGYRVEVFEVEADVFFGAGGEIVSSSSEEGRTEVRLSRVPCQRRRFRPLGDSSTSGWCVARALSGSCSHHHSLQGKVRHPPVEVVKVSRSRSRIPSSYREMDG